MPRDASNTTPPRANPYPDAPGAGSPNRAGVLWVFAGVALGLLGLSHVASVGEASPGAAGLAIVLGLLLQAGAAPMAYLLASAGVGSLLEKLLPEDLRRWPTCTALGLGVLLVITLTLGTIGLLSGGPLSLLVAWAPIALGLALLTRTVLTRVRARTPGAHASTQLHPLVLCATPALCVLLVAACSPPGSLWGTEFGSFDSLSYHLQLPQEWLSLGRIATLKHNVYSALPSGIEAVFLHLGVMSGARAPSAEPAAIGIAWGLVAGEGVRTISTHLFHAACTILAALTAADLCRALIARTGLAECRPAPILAGLVVLGTPWAVVTGSLAYNEMLVAALLAPALGVALSRALPAWPKALALALLVGGATLAKPTAALFVGLPIGMLALATTAGLRPRAMLVAVGALATLAVLAPWLARNLIDVGNPIFPYGSGVFGLAHWTIEQHARFAAGHHFAGSVAERALMLVRADPATSEHRGLMHAQWAWVPIVGTGALALAAMFRPSRAPALALAFVLITQALLWMGATHLQSRFLLPMLPIFGVSIGLALAAVSAKLAASDSSPSPARALGALFPRLLAAVFGLAPGLVTYVIFSRELGGAPNRLLAPSVPGLSGELLRAELPRMSPEQRAEQIGSGPVWLVNLEAPRWLAAGRALGLLGDSTPFYYAVPVRWATTWDANWAQPIIEAEPEVAARLLRESGLGLVLVNFAELDRLARSGFASPTLAPDRVRIMLESLQSRGALVPIRAWPEQRRVLFRVVPTALSSNL
ncbi:MAG: hypothetical protein SFY95_05590 [Planctomycetota bacterium]|nr:hypothetical protein [Planctomycetota bacterium]